MHVSPAVRAIMMFSLAATVGACAPAGYGQGSLISVSFVSREPPPERVEVIPARPSNDVVWVSGRWAANGNDYTWREGSWERPESGKKEWVKGKWVHEDRGWHYMDGHWQ
ncbi:MAG TPA: hypothetical protein VIJ16_05030 [Gemmatimonadaceae bacterium]